MIRERRIITYSYETGDQSLPHLKDMVSKIEDPQKNEILSYLKLHCIAASPGIVYDQITPGNIIGSGILYSDGAYVWDDAFYNYVQKYNIPVPAEFREFILDNYNSRMERHAQLELVNSIEIYNNPYLGYRFKTKIYKNGVVKYWNNIECKDGAVMYIKPDIAEYIIDPITTELFCYDSDNHGGPMMADGYYWHLSFYKNDEEIERIDGSPDEDRWRYNEIRKVVRFVERYIQNDLGSGYMTYYDAQADM